MFSERLFNAVSIKTLSLTNSHHTELSCFKGVHMFAWTPSNIVMCLKTGFPEVKLQAKRCHNSLEELRGAKVISTSMYYLNGSSGWKCCVTWQFFLESLYRQLYRQLSSSSETNKYTFIHIYIYTEAHRRQLLSTARPKSDQKVSATSCTLYPFNIYPFTHLFREV